MHFLKKSVVGAAKEHLAGTFRKVKVNEIEIYVFDAPIKDAPILFSLHGRGGNHDDVHMRIWANKLCKRGYTVLTMDLRNHGKRCVDKERNGSWVKNNPS